ncbi:MAG: hypothetical protein IJK90_09890 [Bacteroidales bacterium]|nr:hypothetical protein [Bacteroidales bacterium]
MKAIKSIAIAIAACMALLMASCTEISPEPKVGSYTCTADINVSSSEGSGIIFFAMRDAVLKATRGYDTRSSAGDNAAISAAESAAAQYKDQANKKIVVSVVFQPGNEMGKGDSKPVVLKSFTFTPVN